LNKACPQPLEPLGRGEGAFRERAEVAQFTGGMIPIGGYVDRDE
jgi:hypothetical protein